MHIRSTIDLSRLPAGVRRAGFAALALLVLGFASCDDPTDPAPSATWKTTLAGAAGFTDLTGTTDVSVWPTSLRSEVKVNKAGSQKTYVWKIARGTCADPRAIVGKSSDYAEFRTDTAGVGKVTVRINSTLATDSAYHVSLHPKDQATTVASCGNLTKQ